MKPNPEKPKTTPAVYDPPPLSDPGCATENPHTHHPKLLII